MTQDQSRQPSLAEVLKDFVEYRLSALHVCLPGYVESYDVAKQTCSVKLAVKNVLKVAGGEEALDFPVIPDVPLAHPRAGGWFLHMPITSGDSVLVVFAERSLDQWRSLGGVQDPLDLRKHALPDAIAVPLNLYPDASALVGLAAGSLSLGRQGGSSVHVKPTGAVTLGSETPTDAVATANKVLGELNKIAAAATAIALLPPAADLATAIALANGIKAAFVSLLAAPFPVSVASTKVGCDP